MFPSEQGPYAMVEQKPKKKNNINRETTINNDIERSHSSRNRRW